MTTIDEDTNKENSEDEKLFSTKALEDFELIKLAVEHHDEAAYGKLMKKYWKAVYHTLLKMIRNSDDAEDLTIEAFGKAFNRLAQYTPNFAFSTWLFKIATNN